MASFSTTGTSNTLMPTSPVAGLLVLQPQSAAGFSCLWPHSKLADIPFTHTMVIAVFSSATPNTKEDYQTFCFSLNGRRHGVQHPVLYFWEDVLGYFIFHAMCSVSSVVSNSLQSLSVVLNLYNLPWNELGFIGISFAWWFFVCLFFKFLSEYGCFTMFC